MNEGQYSTSSDIYSFGIIMWEILYGRSVSYNQEFGSQLQFEICSRDLRPKIVNDTPQCYISLMKKCWDKESVNRPSAAEICKILTDWQDDEKILLEFTKSEEILKDIQRTHIQTYSEDIYKSKFINYTAPFYQGIIN